MSMMAELMNKMAKNKANIPQETEEQKAEKEERKQRQAEARKQLEQKLNFKSNDSSQIIVESQSNQVQSTIVSSSTAPPPPPPALLNSIITNPNAPPPPPMMFNNVNNINQNSQIPPPPPMMLPNLTQPSGNATRPPQIPLPPQQKQNPQTQKAKQPSKDIVSDDSKLEMQKMRKEAQRLLEEKLSGNSQNKQTTQSNDKQSEEFKIVTSSIAPPPPPPMIFNSLNSNNTNEKQVKIVTSSQAPPPPPPMIFNNLNSNNNTNEKSIIPPKMKQNNESDDVMSEDLKKEMQNMRKEAQKQLDEKLSNNSSQSSTLKQEEIKLIPPPIHANSNKQQIGFHETPTPEGDNEESSRKQTLKDINQKEEFNSFKRSDGIGQEIKLNIDNRKTGIQSNSNNNSLVQVRRSESSSKESPTRKSKQIQSKSIPQQFNLPINKDYINDQFKNSKQIMTLAPWSTFKVTKYNTIQQNIRQMDFPEQSVLFFKRNAILVEQLEGFIQNNCNDGNLKIYRKNIASLVEAQEKEIQKQEEAKQQEQIVKVDTKLYNKTIKSLQAAMQLKSEQNNFEDCIPLRNCINRLKSLTIEIEKDTDEASKTNKINFLNQELQNMLASSGSSEKSEIK